MSSPAHRGAQAALAAGTGAVLVVAAWLEPAPAGLGTHRQLGLPPCTFHALTGVPCPMCGATTTFALMADGRIVDGLTNHPTAGSLFLACVAVVGIAGAEAVWPTGRWGRLGEAAEPWSGLIAAGFLTALMAGWTWKIFVG